MKKPIRIAIAEDHALVRQGMVALLKEEKDINLVFDVSDGSALLQQLKKNKVDVVLLDLEMPIVNGHQALRIIAERYSTVHVIIISMHYSDPFISECITMGAKGFLPKNCDFETVVDAIYAVHEQGYYFDDKISRSLLKKLEKDKEQGTTISGNPLTSREHQILELICNGKTNKIIAELLAISIRTVESHRKSISDKTNSHNIAGLVLYAVKNELYNL
ncbi:MAG: response regulator transcription factor [Crocinitomicaceae bacterium]|nr:response regulator transcription factor [Crocinitomicaceae bacterium]